MNYNRSLFREIENYVRSVVGLDEADIHLILSQYILDLVINGIPRGIYTIKDLLEVVYNMRVPEGTLQIEYDDISMNAKFVSNPFSGTLGVIF